MKKHLFKQFGRGGTTLLVILERRPQFISYLRDEASVSWVNLRGGCWIFFIYVQNYAGGGLEFYFMFRDLPGELII